MKLLGDIFAAFATEQVFAAIPGSVVERAKLLMLDAIGIAIAAGRYEFAEKTLAGLARFGSGDSVVIGREARLPLRDAVMMNGTLINGLDFGDTYLPGSLHLSGSCVSTAIGMAAACDARGQDLLTACILGLEVGARLGAATRGLLAKTGFHAAGIIGAFAAAVVAARLLRLTAAQTAMAQGIALSMTAGTLQPIQEGAWTKRLHPGWAAVSGITAATLAAEGFIGLAQTYEGQYGLFNAYLHAHAADIDFFRATDGLREQWEFPNTSIKLYPACYHSHAFMNATIALRHAFDLSADDLESIHTLVAAAAVPLICEPAAIRRAPGSSYAAQFSLPYGVACCIARGRFGLEEIEEESYTDAKLREIADKVSYQIDAGAGFPKTRTGEVIIRTKSGRLLSRRDEISPTDPAPADAIRSKFMDATRRSLTPGRATALMDLVMQVDTHPSAQGFAAQLAVLA